MEITLSTLHKFSFQQIFEKIANHLINQNERSEDEENCRYKQGELKCGAGCLISEEEYKSIEFIEGKAFTQSNFEKFKNITPKHFYIIRSLQIIHDKKAISDWKKELINFAKKEELKHDFIIE